MGINFQNVSYKYSYNASETLKNINLKIDGSGEFIFILGHTGSGKSTLVQNMNALLLPSRGNICIFDKNIVLKEKKVIKINTKKNRQKYYLNPSKRFFAKGTRLVYSGNLKQIRKHIGLVFQFPEYQLFETTILKDVMFGPKNYGLSEDIAIEQSKKACELVGLSKDLWDRSPFSLSGGQMRRVAIAGIFAINPDVIILDEPTVGLDPVGKEELMDLLTKIHNETSKTIIMISHDMNIVAKYAKRIIVMNDGEIVYDGNKRYLFEDIETLHKYNLELPFSAKLALILKDKQLISFTHLPLSKEELEKVILGGDVYE